MRTADQLYYVTVKSAIKLAPDTFVDELESQTRKYL